MELISHLMMVRVTVLMSHKCCAKGGVDDSPNEDPGYGVDDSPPEGPGYGGNVSSYEYLGHGVDDKKRY